MIVIAITIIIATFAIPLWQNYAANTNLKTAAREVMADIFNVRQRAVAENIARTPEPLYGQNHRNLSAAATLFKASISTTPL
jgi:Tfp pilus assembly protein FimT